MDLNGARIFVRVARLGSFTKAALELGLPNSTVSDRISDLEQDLGVSLLVRTTRKLHLTDAGAVFFKKAELAVTALIGAGEEASSFQSRPTGTLRMTAPGDFDLSSICDSVVQYLSKYPDVEVELILTNRVVDLVSEGFDIAIRAGAVKEAGLTAKRLGMSGLILVASPTYVQAAPALKTPDDLSVHKCLIVSPEREASGRVTWNLISTGGQKAKVAPAARISSNSVAAIKHLLLIGEGIALLPPTLIHEDLAHGRLARVLPQWSTSPQASYLVYTARKSSTPKVKEMIPLLEPRIRKVVK